MSELCKCREKSWTLVCTKCGGELPSCLDCKSYEDEIRKLKNEIKTLKAELQEYDEADGVSI